MLNDMTKGKPFRLIIMFTIPVLIGNLFQQFYNVVDSIIVGQFLGVEALASVGSTGSLVFLVIGWVTGMTSGFSILIAQSFGAGDYKRLRHYVAMATYLCVIMAVVMTGGLLAANHWILRLMNTPDNIFQNASAYMGIIYSGLTVTIMYNMLSGMARALGDSKTPLYFLVISSILNILLDLLFVAVLPFGVAGAGYATIISQGVSAILCFFYIRRKFELLRFGREDMKVSGRSIWNLLCMGIPMGLQFSITAIGTMIVQSSLNLLGHVYIAAFSAAGKVQNIVIQIFPAMGVTAATFVGQNAGAGQYDRIRQGVKQTFWLLLGCSVICAGIVYFFGETLVQVFVEDKTGEIRQVASQMFRISLWFYPCLSVIFLFRNTLQGLGDGLVPMLGGVFELIARAAVIFLLADKMGFVGICIADPVAWVSALIPLIPVYLLRMRKVKRMGL